MNISKQRSPEQGLFFFQNSMEDDFMKTEQFNQVVEEQLKRCKDILIVKAREYATDDRLHNFKVAAELENCTPRQALAGMMAKHTVSIYDMCRSDVKFSDNQWNEKITGHINYLLLLRAIVEEENENILKNEKLLIDFMMDVFNEL